MIVNWILVFSISKTNHNIKTHNTFRIITHLIKFWFFYESLNWNALHPFCIVYYIYWTSIFKKVEPKFYFVPFWLWPCIAHPIYLVEKKKIDPTIKRGKIWIPFIQLGIRPTFTLGPRRDQLVICEQVWHHESSWKRRVPLKTWTQVIRCWVKSYKKHNLRV
jgi:hypothetical protein